MPKCIILIGPPCSGKTTWAREKLKCWNYQGYVLSADVIREEKFGKKYKYNSEKWVWEEFDRQLKECKINLIIDNTSCSHKAVKKIISTLNPGYEIEYKTFDVPFWKLFIRNYTRRWKTGKWIPIPILKRFKQNFDSIKDSYK